MAPPPPPAAAAAGLMAVTAKRYTLTALLVTLAVATIVTGLFVLLCPSRIAFSVTRTDSISTSSSLELRLTLAADNPSRRAKVTYGSMFVDVSYGTAPGAQWDYWVPAAVMTRMPLWQPEGPATIDATVTLVDAPWIQAWNMTGCFSVMVTAQARFRVGVAWTRLYDIKVSCSPVSFFPEKAKPAAGGVGGGGCAAGLPVKCV